MQTVKYHPKALTELFQSANWYDRRQAGLGDQLFAELDATVARIRADPFRPRADPAGVRSLRLKRFPFRLYYATDPERIRILAVAHAKRRPGYWRHRTEDAL